MAKKTTIQSPANDTLMRRKRSPIDLRIQGDDILLSGRFHRWQATAFTDRDLDELSVRMAVDSTSPDQLTIPADDRRNLFAFRASEVRRENPVLYRAKGALVTSTGTHPFEMRIELPDGHNAFFGVSFVAGKAILGDAWTELVTGGSDGGGIDAERRLDPRSGVREPDLAAA
jgi:hypothetical protein